MGRDDMRPAADLRAHVRSGLFPGEQLYAVVDGARDLELAYIARDRFGLGILSLFEEPGATRLAHVAPYLVPIDLDSEYLDLWVRRLWSNAGILVLSAICVLELRAHLRRMFVVTDEHAEEYFFRFYDPRVLRVYLPTCTVEEGREFFGPIRRILVESEQRGTTLSYSVDQSGVKTTRHVLAGIAPGTATGGR